MPLPFKVDDLTSVPESARELYEKDDESGAYFLPVTGIDEHEEVRGLKGALESTKDRLRKAIRERDTFKDRALSDEDREEFDRLREEASRRRDGDDDDALQEAIAKRDDYWQKQLDKAKSENDELRTVITQDDATMIEGALQGSLAKAGVLKDHVEAVEALFRVKRKIEVERADGRRRVVIEDDLGDMVPLDSFIPEWAKSDAASPFMPPVNGSGGGGGGGDGGGSGKKPSWEGKKWSDLTMEEKIEKNKATAAA